MRQLLPILSLLLLPLSTGAQRAPVEWTLRRELTISGDGSGPAALTHVLSASRGPNGVLLVSQPSVPYLVAYDANGRVAGTAGRAGNGPGEFRDISMWGWRGDSVWAYDHSHRRLTVLMPDGRFIRSASDTLTRTSGVMFGSLLNNGKVLHYVEPPMTGPRGARRAPAGTETPMRLRITHDDGRLAQDIGPFTNVTSSIEIASGDRRTYLPWIWADMPLYGRSPDGAHVVVVESRHPTTSSGTFSISRYTTTGPQQSTVSQRYQAHAFSLARADSIERLLRSDFTRTKIPPQVVERALALAPPSPKWIRAFDRIVVQNDGVLWLRTAADWERWLAVSAGNVILAEVRVPPKAKVLFGEPGVLWVAELDEFDVPAIVRYRVAR